MKERRFILLLNLLEQLQLQRIGEMFEMNKMDLEGGTG
jgi:hypothetical protein